MCTGSARREEGRTECVRVVEGRREGALCVYGYWKEGGRKDGVSLHTQTKEGRRTVCVRVVGGGRNDAMCVYG